MNALEFLKKGRSLIEKPEHWTQRVLSRDKDGNTCDSFLGDDACSFCTMGALLLAAQGVARDSDPEFLLADSLLDKVMGGNYVEFNDSHTHAEVLAAWDKAIVAAGNL